MRIGPGLCVKNNPDNIKAWTRKELKNVCVRGDRGAKVKNIRVYR